MSHDQPLCSTCLTLPLLSLPTLPSSWNRVAIPAKAHPSLHSLLASPPQSTLTPTSSILGTGYPYHTSLSALCVAARAGCSICSVVQRGVDVFLQDWDEQCKEDEKREWRKKTGEQDARLDWSRMSVARGRNDNGGFMVLVRDAREEWVAWVVAAVGMVVDDDDSLAPLIRGRKIDTSRQGIDASLNRAVQWVRRCNERCSSGCRPRVSAPLPARVLDLGIGAVEEEVMLCEPAQGETGRYAALSYVWGETNPYATTRGDLEENKGGIDVGRLPKTIGDAARVARKLGVRFLWVDALCTTQDEAKQHHRSTPPTASIYSNAYVVLSATGSPSATSGISVFSPDRVSADRYHGFSYSTTTDTENNEEEELKGTVYAYSTEKDVAVFSGTHDLISEQPLSQRAWALQERWLARRVLHFGSSQMFFECSCGIWGEEGFYQAGKGDSEEGDGATSALSSLTLSSSSPSEAAFLGGKKKWDEILTVYSRLNLTYPTDKLPALANLARAYRRQQDRAAGTNATDEYVAGFWRSELLGSLIWQAIGTTTPCPVYRSPSWSWAAIDGPFGTFTPGQGHDDRGEWKALASILSCDVVLKDEADPYGEIKAAMLTLRTPLERLLPPTSTSVPHGEEVLPFPSEQKGPKMRMENGNEDFMGGPFDSPAHAEMARGRQLFAAVLWWRFVDGCGCGQGVPYYHTVIVARVQGDREGVGAYGDVYERLGKMPVGKQSLGECAWMDGEGKVGDEGALETIVLV